MKGIKYISGIALLALCMAQTVVSELYETKTFDEITPSGIQVGNLLFSNFSSTSYMNGTIAVAPESGSIKVTGVYVDGNYGIRFNAPWLAGSEAKVNSTISFQVQTASGSEMYINNNLFALSVSSVGSAAGLLNAVETVWDAEPGSSGANQLSSLSLLDTTDLANQKLTDYRDFSVNGSLATVNKIWVKSSITLVGGDAGESGITHLSEFTQTFTQIPEPTSAGMLCSGTIMAMLWRSRNRKQLRRG